MKTFFRIFLISFFFIFFTNNIFSQTTIVKGVVKDGATGETVIGANVLYAVGQGVITDLDGNFRFEIPNGEYTITVSYVGYTSQTNKIKALGKPISLNFTMTNHVLNEVEIVADIAKTRETPVAFSAITPKKIQEELGSRDIPMILNTTPGVYATESGGGSGDARISIRGFNQRNIAVMVDGIPVNDMENGQVYWSNWDGLGDITRSMQVQRGLGASKLAVTSVGGTMNIITLGIDSKMEVRAKQEVGNNGFLKTSLAYNSGMLKNDWGFTLAASRKTGNGWVDQTWTDAWSYFFKVQKRFGEKHLLTLGVNGAPQKHGQRPYKMPIAVLNKEYAAKLGVNVDSVLKYSEYSRKANNHDHLTLTHNPWTGKITKDGNEEIINVSANFYHKPLFSLSHYYTINPKLYLSTNTYVSLGSGGGTGFNSSSGVARDSTGMYNLQAIYNTNSTSTNILFSETEHNSNTYLRSSMNNHQWYGGISTLNYEINNVFSLTTGIDLRSYKGEHYQEIYDLLGGDYNYQDAANYSQPKGQGNESYYIKHVGDKVRYYYDGYVNWGGVFGQFEMKKGRWAAFVTGSYSETGYKRVDHFAKKDLVLADTILHVALGWGDTLYTDGNNYAYYEHFKSTVNSSQDTVFVTNKGVTTAIANPSKYTIESSEARIATSDWQRFSSYTIKTGANFNVSETQNVFANIGFLNIPPPFNSVFARSNNDLYSEVKNQEVIAAEIGYGFNYRKFKSNINAYYTLWKNKPLPPISTNYQGEPINYNINGLDALHKGIELDFAYKIIKQLDFEGAISLGDWKYNNDVVSYLYDENNTLLAVDTVNAKGVYVGDAAQIQLTGSVKYEPVKNLYFKPRVTYNAKNYADMDPSALKYDKQSKVDNSHKNPWQIPNSLLVDFYAGYNLKYKKIKYTISAGFLNVLNTVYITDALSRGPDAMLSAGSNFNATYSEVFMGQGRRFNTSLKISF